MAEQIAVAEIGKATGGAILLANKVEGIHHIRSIVWSERGIELLPLNNPDQITDTRLEDKAIYTTFKTIDREALAEIIMEEFPGCRVGFWDSFIQ